MNKRSHTVKFTDGSQIANHPVEINGYNDLRKVRMKALSMILLLAVTTASAQSTPATPMPEDVAIFAVRHNVDGQSLSIVPVVTVHYGSQDQGKVVPSLYDPVPDRPTAQDFARFEKSFYRPGSKLSVFSGGSRLGVARVTSSNVSFIEDGEGSYLSAAISYHGAGRPRLAANTTSQIPGHLSTRRAATPAEKSILLRLAKQWLIEYGLDRRLLERGTLGEVISTELRKGVGQALIGRFDVKSQRATHRLFAIAEPDGGSYRLTLANLEVQPASSDEHTERTFVDQLDINNDGVDEVITETQLYENCFYDVWKFYANEKGWSLKHSGGSCS